MQKKIWYFSLIIILFALNIIYAQDSLYLIMTLDGQSESPINYVNGIGDINADGYDDFMISFKETNICKIFYGNDSNNFHPNLVINPPESMPNILNFGGYFKNIGDINNDNFDDFMINGIYTKLTKGFLALYLGGKEIDSLEDFVYFNKIYLMDGFGESFDNGDLNGDGYNDFIVSNPYNWSDGIGDINLFYGNDSGAIPVEPNITLKDKKDSLVNFFGYDLKALNLNGDIYDDLMISTYTLDNIDSHKVFIFFGREKFQIEPDINMSFDPIMSYYISFSVLDFNKDGYDDFYLGPTKRFYFGGPNFNKNSFITFEDPKYGHSFGYNAAKIGDINKDGYDDLIIGEKDYLNSEGTMVGGAYVFLGNSEMDNKADFFLEGSVKWGGFGNKYGELGDFNRDGFPEFFILEENYPDNEHPKGRIYIYSMKKFIVNVENENDKLPAEYKLHQNYPNPFNPTTKISFVIPNEVRNLKDTRGTEYYSVLQNVTLKVYDVLGREVATLVSEQKSAGSYEVTFDATDLSSGIYFYRLEAGSFAQTRKMILLR